jgi:hypothetical protein
MLSNQNKNINKTIKNSLSILHACSPPLCPLFQCDSFLDFALLCKAGLWSENVNFVPYCKFFYLANSKAKHVVGYGFNWNPLYGRK